jgi:hypothetical protein
MKKVSVLILMVLFLTVSSGVMAQNPGYFEAKLGLETFGNGDISYQGFSYDDDTDAGISLTGEYKVPLKNNQWTFGGGLNYQFGRAIDNPGAEDFNFTSFYGLAQYDMVDSPIYLLGKLGYNTLNLDNIPSGADENGGLYYGLGAGVNFGENNQYVFEALYSVNNGELEENNGDTYDFDYSLFALSLGMKF